MPKFLTHSWILSFIESESLSLSTSFVCRWWASSIHFNGTARSAFYTLKIASTLAGQFCPTRGCGASLGRTWTQSICMMIGWSCEMPNPVFIERYFNFYNFICESERQTATLLLVFTSNLLLFKFTFVSYFNQTHLWCKNDMFPLYERPAVAIDMYLYDSFQAWTGFQLLNICCCPIESQMNIFSLLKKKNQNH